MIIIAVSNQILIIWFENKMKTLISSISYVVFILALDLSIRQALSLLSSKINQKLHLLMPVNILHSFINTLQSIFKTLFRSYKTLYGSISTLSRPIKTLYGSVKTLSRPIKTLYGSVKTLSEWYKTLNGTEIWFIKNEHIFIFNKNQLFIH